MDEISLIRAAVAEAVAAKIAECVYVVDSAGALVLSDAQAQVQALIAEIGSQAQVGFHGHRNLSLGVANSVLACQAGATQIDGGYSSFLLHAQRAATRYGVPAHAILQRVGEAGYVGGQEDMTIDIALQLQAERSVATV